MTEATSRMPIRVCMLLLPGLAAVLVTDLGRNEHAEAAEGHLDSVGEVETLTNERRAAMKRQRQVEELASLHEEDGDDCDACRKRPSRCREDFANLFPLTERIDDNVVAVDVELSPALSARQTLRIAHRQLLAWVTGVGIGDARGSDVGEYDSPFARNFVVDGLDVHFPSFG